MNTNTEKPKYSELSKYDAFYMKYLYEHRFKPYRYLAEKYNVSLWTVSKIIKEKPCKAIRNNQN